MSEENLERAAAMAATIAGLDKAAKKRGLDAFQRAALLDQRNAAIDGLGDFLRQSLDWYSVEDADKLPPLLSIEAAARLCGLEPMAGYYLAHHEWQCMVKTFGTKGRCIRTAALLEWLGK